MRPTHTLVSQHAQAWLCRWARIPLEDVEGEAIQEHFQAAIDFVQDAQASGGAALVHCHEGRSRSVTLVLAYLLLTQARPPWSGLTLLLRRPSPHPCMASRSTCNWLAVWAHHPRPGAPGCGRPLAGAPSANCMASIKSKASALAAQGMTLQQALDFVRAKHPVASPNAGFLQRLVSLDTELHGGSSVKVAATSGLGCHQSGAACGGGQCMRCADACEAKQAWR